MKTLSIVAILLVSVLVVNAQESAAPAVPDASAAVPAAPAAASTLPGSGQ